MSSLKLFCAVTLLLVLPIASQAQTVNDHRSVGGLNLSHWCVEQFGRNTRATKNPAPSNDWSCVKDGSRFVRAIPLDAVCRRQYRNARLVAELRRSDRSWVCVRP